MSSADPVVVLRADASKTAGVGHVMRSLTLGRALIEQGCKVELLTRELTDDLRRRSQRMGIPVIELTDDAGSASDAQAVVTRGPDLAVIDGYFFSPWFFEALASADVAHVVIDDNHESTVSTTGMVLNQNPHADCTMYTDASTTCRLLLGPRYALIRPEVRGLRELPRELGNEPVVLVAIGGTDSLGLAARVAETLACLSGHELVVAGTSATPRGARRAASDIAQELARADVAVIGAGTTMWEACCLGVPAVALVVADNQAASADATEAAGAVVAIDCRRIVSFDTIRTEVARLLAEPETRRLMSRRGSAMVDGDGAVLVAKEIVLMMSEGPPP